MKNETFQPDFPTGYMAVLSEREYMEFEVSQLVDGTLDPSRHAAVEAAIAKDAELSKLLTELRQVDAVLTRTPPPAVLEASATAFVASVMAHVLADAGTGTATALAGSATLGSGSIGFWSKWGITITSAAAAMIVGVTVGVVAMNTGNGPDDVADNGVTTNGRHALKPMNQELDDPTLIVTGPGIASAGGLVVDGTAARIGGSDLSVIGVAGLDLRAAYSPEVADSSETVGGLSPDYAAIYNAGVVVERPSRVVVAGVAGSD